MSGIFYQNPVMGLDFVIFNIVALEMMYENDTNIIASRIRIVLDIGLDAQNDQQKREFFNFFPQKRKRKQEMKKKEIPQYFISSK